MISKRAKASRTYRDSSDNDVGILGSTQGIGAPVIVHSTASSGPAKIAAVASSLIRHRYSYRDDSNAEDGDEDFVAFRPAEKYNKDLSDVEVVEKSRPKIQRRRVGKARGRGG